YSQSEEGWSRVWQTEQNTYTDKNYKPQTIDSVLISPYNKGNEYLVLTLVAASWCSSAWLPIFYRAFRLGPDPGAALLIEAVEPAYLGDSRPTRGSIRCVDVRVEVTERS